MDSKSISFFKLLKQCRHFILTLSLLITGVLYSAPAVAQQSTDEKIRSILQSQMAEETPVEVLVLGTFHFKNVPEFYDIKAPENQQEIQKLVNTLAEFSPDKIALEFERKDSSYVDSLYRTYRNGTHELTVNERQQIGFRLAKQLNHQKVHAIDYQKPWGMKETMKWAKKNDPEFVEFAEKWQQENARMDSILLKNKTVSEILSLFASDAYLDRIQEARMRMLEVGADKNYIGVEPVASVYKRNMRIFANITAIAEPGDRVLIVYGAGHSYFFNEFVEQHANMELVDPGRYLAD